MATAIIRLNGVLGERFCHELRASVATVKDAIRCLEANFADFRQFMIRSSDIGIVYQVTVGEWELSEDDLYAPIGTQVITITPIPAGASATMRIIAGVVLVAVGVFTGGAGFALAGAFISIGLSLAIGGIISLFNQPTAPDPNEEDEEKPSFIFNGGANTATAGGRVPLVFGELIVGSQTVSASIRVYTTLDDSADDE